MTGNHLHQASSKRSTWWTQMWLRQVIKAWLLRKACFPLGFIELGIKIPKLRVHVGFEGSLKRLCPVNHWFRGLQISHIPRFWLVVKICRVCCEGCHETVQPSTNLDAFENLWLSYFFSIPYFFFASSLKWHTTSIHKDTGMWLFRFTLKRPSITAFNALILFTSNVYMRCKEWHPTSC